MEIQFWSILEKKILFLPLPDGVDLLSKSLMSSSEIEIVANQAKV
jgi:hypothetical protein